MKFCRECGCENIDEAEFCRNCGVRLKEVTDKPRPIDDAKVIVKNRQINPIVAKLFYKTDKYSGDLRIAKAKSISIIVFVAFFLLGMAVGTAPSFFVVFLVAIIFGLIFALPTYIVGYIAGVVIDKLSN